jgi:COP9 signalosome complex subunit 2
MGIICECGGKMHMSEGKARDAIYSRSCQLTIDSENWKDAQSDFFESFTKYDEAGSLQRIQVLKYLVLTTMLMGSDINPFDSQQTKPYKNDPRIAAMTELVDAYQRDDINQYETILQKNKDLLADPFIAENIDEVTRNMRTKAVVKLVAPYTRFRLDFIAKRLNIGIPEVQDIVGFLIMDKKLRGKINQDAGTVEIESRADLDRMHAVADWTASIRSLASFVLNEGEGFKSEESGLGGGGGPSLPPLQDPLLSSSSQRPANTGKRKPNRAPGK